MGAGVGVRGCLFPVAPRVEAALIMETGQCNIGINKERRISSTCPGELGLPACWPWLSHHLRKQLVILLGQKGRRQGVFPRSSVSLCLGGLLWAPCFLSASAREQAWFSDLYSKPHTLFHNTLESIK